MNKWLFIDFDNTMMGTEQYALPSLIDRFNFLYQDQIDHLLTVEEFKQHFHGQAREVLCKNLSDHFNIPVDCAKLYENREENIMQYYRSLPDGIPMTPYLIETLSLLKQHAYQFAMVSNNPIQRALTAMRFANNQKGEALCQFFGTHFFEAKTKQKPHPDVYLQAIHQVNASAQQSFAIEDSVGGAQAAIAAGLRTFGFTGFSTDPKATQTKLLEAGCITVFDDWRDLPLQLPPHTYSSDVGYA